MGKGGQNKEKYSAQKSRTASNKARRIARAKLKGDLKAGVALTQGDYKEKVKVIAPVSSKTESTGGRDKSVEVKTENIPSMNDRKITYMAD